MTLSTLQLMLFEALAAPLFSDRGETTLRGFDDPVRLHELRWQEEGQ